MNPSENRIFPGNPDEDLVIPFILTVDVFLSPLPSSTSTGSLLISITRQPREAFSDYADLCPNNTEMSQLWTGTNELLPERRHPNTDSPGLKSASGCVIADRILSPSLSSSPELSSTYEPSQLHTYAKTLCQHGVERSEVASLDLGLEHLHRTLTSNPDESIACLIIHDIASALHARWDLTGILNDLQDSIYLRRLSLGITDDDTQVSLLCNISSALFLRFTHFPRIVDLDEAIALGEQALKLTEKDSKERFGSLCTLAQMYLVHWDYDDGDHSIREHAIYLLREAVSIAPFLHEPLDEAIALNALSEAIQGRMFLSDESLEECVSLDQRALELVPRDHPERLLTLSAMATTVLVRFTVEERQSDWDWYQALHAEIATCLSSPSSKLASSLYHCTWEFFQQIGHYSGRYGLTSIFHQVKYMERNETVPEKVHVTSQWDWKLQAISIKLYKDTH